MLHLFVTDCLEEMVEHFKVHAVQKFGLVEKPIKNAGGLQKQILQSNDLGHIPNNPIRLFLTKVFASE